MRLVTRTWGHPIVLSTPQYRRPSGNRQRVDTQLARPRLLLQPRYEVLVRCDRRAAPQPPFAREGCEGETPTAVYHDAASGFDSTTCPSQRPSVRVSGRLSEAAAACPRQRPSVRVNGRLSESTAACPSQRPPVSVNDRLSESLAACRPAWSDVEAGEALSRPGPGAAGLADPPSRLGIRVMARGQWAACSFRNQNGPGPGRPARRPSAAGRTRPG